MVAISLIKEMRVAKNALDAYLIISAVRKSVIMIGQRRLRYNWATFVAAARSSDPRMTRSGSIKSLIAEPSRRNSGLETTAKSSGLPPRRRRMMSATQSPVPTGTVDLFTTTIG